MAAPFSRPVSRPQRHLATLGVLQWEGGFPPLRWEGGSLPSCPLNPAGHRKEEAGTWGLQAAH